MAIKKKHYTIDKLNQKNKMKTKIDERENLPSASSIDADIRCLGKPFASKGLVGKKSKSADKGTLIHEVLAHEKDINELSKSEQITAHRIMNEEAFYVDKFNMHNAKSIREKRLWFTDIRGDPLFSGKLDCLIKDGKRGLIIDYKTGWSLTVPIKSNWQIKAQAILAWFVHDLIEIDCVLIHPHHPDTLSEHIHFNEKDLQGFAVTLEGYCEEWKKENNPVSPNNISCEYCLAKSKCKPYQDQLHTIFESVEKNPESRGLRLDTFKTIENIIDSERTQYKEMLLEDSSSVLGWKLQAGITTSISDHARAIELITDGTMISSHHIPELVELSMTKLTNKLAEMMSINKTEAKVKVESLLAEVIVKKPMSPKLVKTNT